MDTRMMGRFRWQKLANCHHGLSASAAPLLADTLPSVEVERRGTAAPLSPMQLSARSGRVSHAVKGRPRGLAVREVLDLRAHTLPQHRTTKGRRAAVQTIRSGPSRCGPVDVRG